MTTLTDRQLLAAAADAAGIPTEWHSEAGCPMRLDRIGTVPWNPLTDDGDALRLAVALNMGISIHDQHCMACAQKGTMQTERERPTAEATRCAIVRAAAALSAA
jgi:hypothetical protein